MQQYIAFTRMGMKETDEGEPVVLPDILAEYHRYEHWNWQHLPWPGAMSDQPWQLMFELECVAEALGMQANLDRLNDEAQKKAEQALAGRAMN